MKKIVLTLCLLGLTTGIALADEITTAQVGESAIQQAEIQSTIDRNTFQNIERNEKFNKSLNRQFPDQKIKYDKSVKENKFSNFDKKGKPNFDKKVKKGELKGAYPQLKKSANGFNPEVRANRPLPKDFIGHRPHKHGDFRSHHPHRDYMRNSHKPQFKNYKRQSHKMSKSPNRRAYKK